jgi:hypothetical protein
LGLGSHLEASRNGRRPRSGPERGRFV